MFIWFIKWFIFSLVLIVILHYLYNFYIDKLTIPKDKDYIYNQVERQNNINKQTINKQTINKPLIMQELKKSLVLNLNKSLNL